MQSAWCFSAIFPIPDGENGNGKRAAIHHILACDALRNDRNLDETRSPRGATTQLLTNLSACLNRASIRS